MNYSELNQMSIEKLIELNSMVVSIIKDKKRISANETKYKLYVGAHVKVNHPRLVGKECVIEKINRTRCVVNVLNEHGGTYHVPISMLSLDEVKNNN